MKPIMASQRWSNHQTSPDLVFLDIQMPGMGGFELLNRLSGGHMPVIVMVTAFDEHAVRAFEAGAIDYLLKPVTQPRLQQSVERAARLTQSPLAVAENIVHLQQTCSSRNSPRISHPEDCRQERRRLFPTQSGGSTSLPG